METTKRVVGRPFQKGQSGNPGGRPKAIAEVIALAREMTTEAMLALKDIALKGESEAARVSALNAILDRGWGKPSQDVKMEGDVTHHIKRIILEDEASPN
jgi:hypothetical protein